MHNFHLKKKLFIILSLVCGTLSPCYHSLIAEEIEGTSQLIEEENSYHGQANIPGSYRYRSPLIENCAITRHQLAHENGDLFYTAIAGKMPITNGEGGSEIAQIGFTTYTSMVDTGDKNESSKQPKPLIFFFNGGPGSSSALLHLGLAGPWRLPSLDESLDSGDNVTKVIPNPLTLLDIAGLVFVDPIYTGFSRPSKGENDPAALLGVHDDAHFLTEFISQFQEHFNAWRSPVYLVGESFGAMRVAEIAARRQSRGLDTAGMILISGYLDPTLSKNPLCFPYSLPTMTAIAWKHKKLNKQLQQLTLEEVVEKARIFSSGALIQAILQGNRLPAKARAIVVNNIAEFTGLDLRYVQRVKWEDLPERFPLQLLIEQEKRLGIYDGQLTTWLDSLADPVVVAVPYYDYEPSLKAIMHRYTTGIRYYQRAYLNVQVPELYVLGAGEIMRDYYEQWNRRGEHSECSVAKLSNLLLHTPNMKLFIANGHYDLVTPFFSNEYVASQLLREISNQVVLKNYEGGHMMYMYKETHKQLSYDMRKFLMGELKNKDSKTS
jgi:carboxypeptidase C (cathepsin A)